MTTEIELTIIDISGKRFPKGNLGTLENAHHQAVAKNNSNEVKRTQGDYSIYANDWINAGKTCVATIQHQVSNEETKANAEFIVKACNEYSNLIEQNKSIQVDLEFSNEIKKNAILRIQELEEQNKQLLEALKDGYRNFNLIVQLLNQIKIIG